jgi:hypothetical protein
LPVVEGAETYEDPLVTEAAGRVAHFGHPDHLRWYGADLRDRITISETCTPGRDVVRYGLMRGEKVFICRKH